MTPLVVYGGWLLAVGFWLLVSISFLYVWKLNNLLFYLVIAIRIKITLDYGEFR
jgi:hypothetical protein